MLRREFLGAAAGASLLSPTMAASAVSRLRRVRPGDAGWPSDSQWSALGQTLGGRLSPGVAMMASCETAPKAADCVSLMKQVQNPFFIGDQPSGTQVSGYLDAWTPKPSAYVIAARSAADVAAGGHLRSRA